MLDLILAADLTGQANTFWNTDIGEAIKAVLAAVGIVVVIVAIFKAIKSVTDGKGGQAAKIIVGAAALAAVMFSPELITGLIELLGTLIDKVLNSGDELVQ